jgi:hypothetical protein
VIEIAEVHQRGGMLRVRLRAVQATDEGLAEFTLDVPRDALAPRALVQGDPVSARLRGGVRQALPGGSSCTRWSAASRQRAESGLSKNVFHFDSRALDVTLWAVLTRPATASRENRNGYCTTDRFRHDA